MLESGRGFDMHCIEAGSGRHGHVMRQFSGGRRPWKNSDITPWQYDERPAGGSV